MSSESRAKSKRLPYLKPQRSIARRSARRAPLSRPQSRRLRPPPSNFGAIILGVMDYLINRGTWACNLDERGYQYKSRLVDSRSFLPNLRPHHRGWDSRRASIETCAQAVEFVPFSYRQARNPKRKPEVRRCLANGFQNGCEGQW
jgi:hypothetical protein